MRLNKWGRAENETPIHVSVTLVYDTLALIEH